MLIVLEIAPEMKGCAAASMRMWLSGESARLLLLSGEGFNPGSNVGKNLWFSLYVDVNGESGYFDRSLAVYGQEGRPCPRCGALVRRDAFMNRSSFSAFSFLYASRS